MPSPNPPPRLRGVSRRCPIEARARARSLPHSARRSGNMAGVFSHSLEVILYLKLILLLRPLNPPMPCSVSMPHSSGLVNTSTSPTSGCTSTF